MGWHLNISESLVNMTTHVILFAIHSFNPFWWFDHHKREERSLQLIATVNKFIAKFLEFSNPKFFDNQLWDVVYITTSDLSSKYLFNLYSRLLWQYLRRRQIMFIKCWMLLQNNVCLILSSHFYGLCITFCMHIILKIFKHDFICVSYSRKFLCINRNSSSLFYYIILSKVWT